MKEDTETKTSKPQEEKREESSSIIRIVATDIPGGTSIYHGLTKIKGISWSISNAICHKLGIDKKRQISSLTEKEIEGILKMLNSSELPAFLVNRRKDILTGINKHLITADLDLQRDFDIRRMKKIRSYRGWRHALGQPVRGQRTKSHFRKGRAIGVQRAKVKPGAKPKKE